MNIKRHVRRLAMFMASAAVFLSGTAPAKASGNYDNASIADKALSYVGQWGGNACKDSQKPGDSGGQCKAFVNCIVWMASGGSQNVGGGYFQPYLNAGGSEITSVESLVKGDIVQVGEGVHTFIIVGRVSGNLFTVVDSNRNYDEMVTSYDRTVALDSNTRAFRMGAVNSAASYGTLYFIKTKNTGSGRVEVHSAAPSYSYQDGQHSVTWFSPADADNGWFQMTGPNLYFIKTKNTGSGRVEVHSATASSKYQSGVHFATALSTFDADNGWFQMADYNRDGVQDLVFIKTKNTGSGRVEFFVLDGMKNFGQFMVAKPTAFFPYDADNGWFQAQGKDLVFIKTRNTGSGRVEYFRATAASGYASISVAAPTAFSPAEQNNGWFSSEDVDFDNRADLLFVKTKNTFLGLVEIQLAGGVNAYRNRNWTVFTWFSVADADNGWFQIDGKQ